MRHVSRRQAAPRSEFYYGLPRSEQQKLLYVGSRKTPRHQRAGAVEDTRLSAYFGSSFFISSFFSAFFSFLAAFFSFLAAFFSALASFLSAGALLDVS